MTFPDVLCQLTDMVNPRGAVPVFTRADFARSKLAPLFVDMLVNLTRFTQSEARDVNRIRHIQATPHQTDWDRWASQCYFVLAGAEQEDESGQQAIMAAQEAPATSLLLGGEDLSGGDQGAGAGLGYGLGDDGVLGGLGGMRGAGSAASGPMRLDMMGEGDIDDNGFEITSARSDTSERDRDRDGDGAPGGPGSGGGSAGRTRQSTTDSLPLTRDGDDDGFDLFLGGERAEGEDLSGRGRNGRVGRVGRGFDDDEQDADGEEAVVGRMRLGDTDPHTLSRLGLGGPRISSAASMGGQQGGHEHQSFEDDDPRGADGSVSNRSHDSDAE